MKKSIQKVLIIRLSSIGDIVLTTPVIRCLKKQIPGVELHFLVKKQYQQVISANPHLAKIWSYDHNFAEIIPQLREEKFDHIIDLHKNLRSYYVRLTLGRRGSSFSKLNIRKWLLVNFRINLLPAIHIVDRYFEAAGGLEITNDGLGLDYFISAQDHVDPFAFPEIAGQKYIAFVIGGKHNTKLLPEDLAVKICRNIRGPIVLLGGPEDRERGDRIRNLSKGNVYNACGAFSINRSASVIMQAEKVITNDTGLMHIAAAFKKTMISIWGNTIPEFGMYPYFPAGSQNRSFVFEVAGLSCRPCSKIGFPQCPKNHFRCMKDQDIPAIIKTVDIE